MSTPENNNITTDKDTLIVNRNHLYIEDVKVVDELWYSDGIYGKSLIFNTDSLSKYSVEEILALLKIEVREITVSNKNGLTFVNYAFYVDEQIC